MELPCYDIMVDLETTGTQPETTAIVQIAAVAFDYDTGRIGGSYNRSLEMSSTRFWDEDTRKWWSGMPDVFERASTINVAHPKVVMLDFQQWVRGQTGALREPTLWAKPVSFEFPFLQSYFREYEVENPFFFRDCIDLQSFIRGMRGDPHARPFDKEVPMVGEAHNALDDVFHQIAVVLTAKHRFAKPETTPTDV